MSDTVTLTVNGSWTQFVDVLKNRQAFKTHGALSGQAATWAVNYGRLPSDWRKVLETGYDYVVYSYGTPIAWHRPADDLWIMPDEKYSVTTSKHQSRIFTAINSITEYPREAEDGSTVWACCESSIGPVCQHRRA